MKRLDCKLIVSDFDGTLANSHNAVTDRVKQAINRYIADGGIFAVCTGRILASILPRVRSLGLKGLVIGGQGSVIADIETGEVLKSVYFSAEQISEICGAFEEFGSNVNVYNDGGFYTDIYEGEPHLALYEDIIGVKAHRADGKLSDFVLRSGIAFNKAAALCRPEDRQRLYEQLYARFADKYDVTCSAKVLVEVSPLGETKGKALKFLADRYGVPIGRTCAVGDNLNDLSMLEAAGYGVAVANSAPELKERVKYITVSNDEDAVARVIEEFGYKND